MLDSAIVGLMCAALVGAPQAGNQVEVAPGTRLDVRHRLGAVSISAWDRAVVEIREPSSGDRPDVRSSGTVLAITGKGEGRLTLVVPREMPVTVNTDGGDVEVLDVNAAITVETGSGSITVRGGRGLVSTTSQTGAVVIEGTVGRVEARTNSRPLRIAGVQGDVQATNVTAPLTISNASSRRVQAETVNGAIRFEGAIQPDGFYSFSTHTGGITLVLPPGTDATIKATMNPDILKVGFPGVEVSKRGEREATAVLGAGSGRIEISSFRGIAEVVPGR